MSNDKLVDQAKDILRRINSNTSVSPSQTREDLEAVREEIDSLMDALPKDGGA